MWVILFMFVDTYHTYAFFFLYGVGSVKYVAIASAQWGFNSKAGSDMFGSCNET